MNDPRSTSIVAADSSPLEGALPATLARVIAIASVTRLMACLALLLALPLAVQLVALTAVARSASMACYLPELRTGELSSKGGR